MKDFWICFKEDFTDKFSWIMGTVIFILLYFAYGLIAGCILSVAFSIEFSLACIVAILIPFVALVIAFLWELASRLYYWLWWKKRR